MAVTIRTEQPEKKERSAKTRAKSALHQQDRSASTISVEQLEKLQYATLDNGGTDTLTDISEVSIQGETSLERLESFLQQVKNPYFFKVGNTPVRITFNNNGAPLEEKLKAHFISLKQKT